MTSFAIFAVQSVVLLADKRFSKLAKGANAEIRSNKFSKFARDANMENLIKTIFEKLPKPQVRKLDPKRFSKFCQRCKRIKIRFCDA